MVEPIKIQIAFADLLDVINAYSLGGIIFTFCALLKSGAWALAGEAATSPTAKAAAKRTWAENFILYSVRPFRQASQSCSP